MNKPLIGITPRYIEFEEGVAYPLTKHIKRYVELNMAMQRYVSAKQNVPIGITIELKQYDEHFKQLDEVK